MSPVFNLSQTEGMLNACGYMRLRKLNSGPLFSAGALNQDPQSYY
jgi:hypothetical protein